jgi:endonuclease G
MAPVTDAFADDGYQSGFLGPEVPLPRPVDPLATVVDLTYPRFSVLLDPERRLARMTGVNIDGEALQDIPRTGTWRLDPRVADEDQAGPDLYARNDLDRGHLVRRRDPGWGDEAQARRATEATFFYTNAAPQAAAFNQSKDLWLGLEDHILAHAESRDARLSVFTAPILAADDPPYRGIRIPRRFLKIAAWSSDAGLAATGFVLDQTDLLDIRQGILGVDGVGAFRTFQAPLADIAEAAAVDLGPLIDADVLAPSGARAPDGDWRSLTAAEEIILG